MTPDLPREFNADAAVNDLIALVGAVDGLTSMTTPAQIARIQEALAPIIAGHSIYRGVAMTISQWALLGFSAWTPGLLMATVGVYREV